MTDTNDGAASGSSAQADGTSQTGNTTDTSAGKAGDQKSTAQTGEKSSAAKGDEGRFALGAASSTAKGDQGAQQPASDKTQSATGETAELKIVLPEGVTIDEEMLAGYTETAKAAGLNSDQASKLAGFYVKQLDAGEKEATAAMHRQNEDWYEELVQDKEFGGAKLQENLAAADMALKRLPNGKALLSWLDDLHLRNLPELVKAFAYWGKAIREDTTTSRAGGGKTLSQREIDDIDFPSSARIGK